MSCFRCIGVCREESGVSEVQDKNLYSGVQAPLPLEGEKYPQGCPGQQTLYCRSAKAVFLYDWKASAWVLSQTLPKTYVCVVQLYSKMWKWSIHKHCVSPCVQTFPKDKYRKHPWRDPPFPPQSLEIDKWELQLRSFWSRFRDFRQAPSSNQVVLKGLESMVNYWPQLVSRISEASTV